MEINCYHTLLTTCAIDDYGEFEALRNMFFIAAFGGEMPLSLVAFPWDMRYKRGTTTTGQCLQGRRGDMPRDRGLRRGVSRSKPGPNCGARLAFHFEDMSPTFPRFLLLGHCIADLAHRLSN
jgi:hypothetical protein